ncbi:mucin-2-like [Toxorhynchites rutilus septentrionalis]|uniref:mucin-2-like n=1 Tax=Toxorhynchites rutilus septentrionalis TaxID=329112 RepID=UPI00247ACECB|nr:mucin-2-like [Toxorhynchites rutilus septentrionalis]
MRFLVPLLVVVALECPTALGGNPHRATFKSLRQLDRECHRYLSRDACGDCATRCRGVIARYWKDGVGLPAVTVNRFYCPDAGDVDHYDRTRACLEEIASKVPLRKSCLRATCTMKCYDNQYGQLKPKVPAFVPFTDLHHQQNLRKCISMLSISRSRIAKIAKHGILNVPEGRCLLRCFMVREGLYRDDVGPDFDRIYVQFAIREVDDEMRRETAQCVDRVLSEPLDSCTRASHVANECFNSVFPTFVSHIHKFVRFSKVLYRPVKNTVEPDTDSDDLIDDGQSLPGFLDEAVPVIVLPPIILPAEPGSQMESTTAEPEITTVVTTEIDSSSTSDTTTESTAEPEVTTVTTTEIEPNPTRAKRLDEQMMTTVTPPLLTTEEVTLSSEFSVRDDTRTTVLFTQSSAFENVSTLSSFNESLGISSTELPQSPTTTKARSAMTLPSSRETTTNISSTATTSSTQTVTEETTASKSIVAVTKPYTSTELSTATVSVTVAPTVTITSTIKIPTTVTNPSTVPSNSTSTMLSRLAANTKPSTTGTRVPMLIPSTTVMTTTTTAHVPRSIELVSPTTILPKTSSTVTVTRTRLSPATTKPTKIMTTTEATTSSTLNLSPVTTTVLTTVPTTRVPSTRRPSTSVIHPEPTSTTSMPTTQTLRTGTRVKQKRTRRSTTGPIVGRVSKWDSPMQDVLMEVRIVESDCE